MILDALVIVGSGADSVSELSQMRFAIDAHVAPHDPVGPQAPRAKWPGDLVGGLESLLIVT